MIELGEGDHEYKFLVDGQWITDSGAPTVENNSGFKNNIIHVQKEDFDAFEALDMDSATVTKAQSHKASKANQVRPQTTFGQEMPLLLNSSGISGNGNENSRSQSTGPPILPPHLLQVILNKDTPLSCEPTLLPEPNHVMLNHLYALSIKDGVMVLSTTQRFKRKYITTLLYKPMGTRTCEIST
jgi:5'-AMP-activated protein kinase regulatory beta subunit